MTEEERRLNDEREGKDRHPLLAWRICTECGAKHRTTGLLATLPSYTCFGCLDAAGQIR
jgi:hypothetical protein